MSVDTDPLARIRQAALVHVHAEAIVHEAESNVAVALEGSHRVDADPLAAVRPSAAFVHILTKGSRQDR